MKTRTRRLLVVLGGVLLLGVAGVPWLVSSYLSAKDREDRASAIDATLVWGRLAPFPASAQEVAITAEGSMFTREFRASFVAPAADIEEWLQRSPGTREAVPTAPSPGVRHFQITAGGGASFAEVTVDDTQQRVFIHVYWS